jgi:hypothetical protein
LSDRGDQPEASRAARALENVLREHPLHQPSELDVRPGSEPLRVRKAGAGELSVTWEDLAGAQSNLYQGTIRAIFGAGSYDHLNSVTCQANARAQVPSPSGNVYFLVSGTCAWGSGSVGRTSRGTERPGGTPGCP